MFKIDLGISSLRAGFTAPALACRGTTISTIKNTSSKATAFLWDFGDSSPVSKDTTPTHTYAHAGTYTITLVAINPIGCRVTDTFRKKITIYEHANPAFTVKRTNCSLTVHFTQTGQNTSTHWAFGDGTHSDTANPAHSFPGQGSYTIRLLVDSGTSCADTQFTHINIKGIKADFSDSFETCSPGKYHFQDLSTGSLKSRLWYLPFASTDTAKNPFFDFGTVPGQFTVSLVVMDSFGCKDSVAKKITVYVNKNISFLDSVYHCNTQVFVKNQSTGIKTLKWYLSDGTTATQDSLTHTFPTDSTISITLITDSGAVCADTLKKTIKISIPKAGYGYSIDTCTGKVSFTNKSEGATAYTWLFDANDTATQPSPSFTFTAKGQYPVKLIAHAASGCIDTITHVISISNGNHKLFIPNVFTPNADGYNNTFLITGLSPCDTYNLAIYNRWGQLLYHARGNYFSWDGIYQGRKLPEGAYYYVFNGRKEGRLEGIVTVIY